MCDAEGRNLYTSDSLLRLVGISQEQCSNYGWSEILHPDDVEETMTAWKECTRTGNNWYREHRMLGVDGKYHSILAQGLPIRDEYLIVDGGKLAGTGAHSYSAGNATGGSGEAARFKKTA